MKVKVSAANGKVGVQSPYNKSFVAKAKNLGGRWDGVGSWVFDARDEAAVRDLCRAVYGTDGEDAPELVTVRWTVNEDGASVFKFGREVLSRRGRDESVRLGSGVVLISGKFFGSGGSAKYPAIGADGQVIEVRDVPRGLVDETEDGVEIVTVADERREALVARISKLEAELAAAKAELDGLK